jgi:C1A family cysteine protease
MRTLQAVVLSLCSSVALSAAATHRYATGYIYDPAYHASLEKLPPPESDEVMPSAIDWRKRGAVTAVKNQGQCGSCWAFSTTGVIEGANAIATGRLLSLSEQALVDCANRRNMGCQGGMPEWAAEWVIDNAGIPEEADYDTYTANEWRCDGNKSAIKDVSISKVQAVDKEEKALLAAVARQPVSVAVYAEPLQTYQGGLVSEGCDGRKDHAILVVGFNTSKFEGEEKPVDYWIVKNSWGTKWGMDGYFYLKRGINGLCVNDAAVVVTVGAAPPAPPPPPPREAQKCGTLAKTKCGGEESCCCTKRSFPIPIACKEWTCCGSGLYCVDANRSTSSLRVEQTCGERP